MYKRQPSYLTVFGNELFFSAGDAINGYALWKSDGTTAGTVMVIDTCAEDRFSKSQTIHLTVSGEK